MRARIAVLAALVAIIGLHFAGPVVAQDITDPLTTAFLPTDQVVVVRNAHQRLAGNLSMVLPGSGVQLPSCTMVSGTTCTATITAYVTAGVCLVMDTAAGVAGWGTISTTTLTIHAASSNSALWQAVCFPNPN